MSRDLGDLGDTIGSALGTIARGATDAMSQNGHGRASAASGDGALSGVRGVAAGAALAVAAPLAAKGAGKVLRHVVSPQRAAEGVKGAVGDVVEKKVDQAGGVPGAMKEAGKQMLTGGGDSKGAPGTGKRRRMPVQQAVDVGVPLEVAYNQWTQFEEWPQFMHRVMQVTQEDDCTVSFKVKVWGMSKQFVAEIVEQRPDERIKWNTTEGVTHSGVVTFHELAPRLTRVQVSLDVEPGSLVEKAARGMRHVKRAVRADLARFKSFIELEEAETGAWRGTIEDGEVVEQDEQQQDEEPQDEMQQDEEPEDEASEDEEPLDEEEEDEAEEEQEDEEPEDEEELDDEQEEDDSEPAEERPAPVSRRRSGGRTRGRSGGEHARRPSQRRGSRRRAGASRS